MKVINKTVTTIAAFSLVSLVLTSCAQESNSGSKEQPTSSPNISSSPILTEVPVNEAARRNNCSIVTKFSVWAYGKNYDDNWNSYDYWRVWEESLWQKIKSSDQGSFNVLMEIRKGVYSQDLTLPPTFGSIYTEDSGTGTVDDFISDAKAIKLLEELSQICPTVDIAFWDEVFHVRDFAIN